MAFSSIPTATSEIETLGEDVAAPVKFMSLMTRCVHTLVHTSSNLILHVCLEKERY
jgi:hypothetical protein